MTVFCFPRTVLKKPLMLLVPMKMKNRFEAILEPTPLFVFMLQYCKNKREAEEVAKIVIKKLQSRGRQTFSKNFENVEILRCYAEAL